MAPSSRLQRFPPRSGSRLFPLELADIGHQGPALLRGQQVAERRHLGNVLRVIPRRGSEAVGENPVDLAIGECLGRVGGQVERQYELLIGRLLGTTV